ncbi:MAG: hypothetical protein JXM70_17225 [Pirellulales bacterium]|nr:hypothetical protein [Pirellulales bacterium]
MRVLIIHNSIGDEALAADHDVLAQVEAVSEAISQLGHDPLALPLELDLGQLKETILSSGAEMVFNLMESLGGSDRLAFMAPALLDVLGCPYSGSPTRALFRLSDKIEAKRILRLAGFPTPDWVSRSSDFRRESAPTADKAAPKSATRHIIKPVYEHASFGIDSQALVEAGDPRSLKAKICEREESLGTTCFAEQYIDGREFNLSMLAGPTGPRVLPAAEIDFCGFSANMPRIVDYRAKWEPDSFEYQNTPRQFEFPQSDSPLLDKLVGLARSCWNLFGLRGYARVDFRVDTHGRPWILEVNANPCLSPDAGFAAALDRGRISFPQAVARILDDAVGPRGNKSCPDFPGLAGVVESQHSSRAAIVGAVDAGSED